MQPPANIKFQPIALFATLTAITAVSIDIMLPAFGMIAQDFALQNSADTRYIVILFIFGMTFGEITFGPLADSIGRKKVILLGLATYFSGSLLAIFAPSIEILFLARIIQGIGAAGSKIGTRALIRDLFEGAAMARVLSTMFSLMILVPLVAPLLGQILIQFTHWRSLFILLTVITTCLSIWFFKAQAETLTPEKRIAISLKTLSANAWLIIKHPKVMAYTICGGLLLGSQLFYIGLAHELFIGLYNTGSYFPIYLSLAALGSGAGSYLNIKLLKHHEMHILVNRALISIAASALIFLAASIVYNGLPPFTIFMIYCFFIFLFIGIIFGNANALAMQSLGRVAGLGASIIASVSSLVAVIVSALFGYFYNESTTLFALILIFASIASYLLVRIAQKSVSKPV